MPQNGPPLDTEEQVTAYLCEVLNTPAEFDIRETPTTWVCQVRPHPEQLRRDREVAEKAARGILPDPGGGYAVYGIDKKNSHVFDLGQNPPDHPALLLDRSKWDKTYFGTGQIHPKPWQVRIDLVAEVGATLAYRIQCVSRTDPPQQPIDYLVNINRGTNKVDYGTGPFPRVLLDAVNRIVHPRYRGEPWLTSATFEL